jgi:hypothetical protein
MMNRDYRANYEDKDILINLFDTSNVLIKQFKCKQNEYFTDANGTLMGIGYKDSNNIVTETIYFGKAIAYIKVVYAED